MAGEFKTIKKSQDFCKWLMEHTDKFPKSRRFSMAVRMENTFLDFVEKVTLANRRRERLSLLHAADEKLFLSRILLRLSHDMKLINTKSYEFGSRSLDEIGRLLGGWIKQQSGGKRGEA